MASVKIFGQRGKHAAPFVDLGCQAGSIQLRVLGQDAVAGLVAEETHIFAWTDAGEGDSGEMLRVGDDGVERELGRVGSIAEPVRRLAWPVL